LAYVFFILEKVYENKSENKRAQKATRTKTKETLKERVHRHLNDISSKITDEDIRNVRTEMEIRGAGPAMQPMSTAENKKRKKAPVKQEKENESGSDKHITPWDILSEE
jgi:hypothetical protein